MKRIAISLLAAFMLTTSAFSVMAEEIPEDSLENHLIVHYDFEGSTLKEQLEDKATAGVSKENLTLYATEDANGKALSYIKDGKAYVASAANNYLACLFPAADASGTDDSNVGADLRSFTGAMTVYTVFKANGKGSYVDVIDVNHYLRTLLKSPTNSSGTMEVRFGETYDHEEKYNYEPADGMVFWGSDTVYCAVTIHYNADRGRLIGETYLSFDGGRNYTRSEKVFSVEEDPFAACEYLMLGKLGAAKAKDKGTSFEIDDFRIYNTKLDKMDIVRMNHPNATEETEKPAESSTPGTTSSVIETQQEAQAATTASASAASPDKDEGCGSSLGIGLVALLTAAAALLEKKRK